MLTLDPGLAAQQTGRGKDSWWDPVVGLRGRKSIGAKTYLTGWAQIGGFGAGSDFISDVFAGVGYSFSEKTSLVGGWRYQSVDRSDNDFVWDVKQSGPIIGLNITF